MGEIINNGGLNKQQLATIDSISSLVEDVSDEDKYLTFVIGDKTFGVNIEPVKEIIEYERLTRIPMTPGHIRGVVNLRGNVVPIIDLANRLNLSGHEISKRTCLIILQLAAEDETMDLGILVDSVSEVLDIPAEDIEPAPSFGVEVRSDFIDGMAKIKGSFVIILDIQKVLSIQELSQFTDLLQGVS
ncbi:MAG: chemotaxis protein CheW [Gammaproteobacteria bacterium]|nr:chemotaxis protein CheW [Gammaproteobacteria bacterium]